VPRTAEGSGNEITYVNPLSKANFDLYREKSEKIQSPGRKGAIWRHNFARDILNERLLERGFVVKEYRNAASQRVYVNGDPDR
jgi:uroporphyrinogen-III synthase